MPRPRPTRPVRTREEVVEITAVGAAGDGLAAGPVYVALTLPGESARVAVAGDRAELVELLRASPDRIAPVSPHYGRCGGCQLQHWAPVPYLAWKVEQLRRALVREGLETEILPAFAAAAGQRRRLGLHARPGPRGVRLGFKQRRSWDVVEIVECAIADPRLVAALPALRRLAEPFLEHPSSAPTLHVTLTATGIDVDVTGVEAKTGGLSADARRRAADAAAAGDLARVTLAGEILYAARPPTVRFGAASVALPPGGFLQAVKAAEDAMAAFALTEAAGARRVADLFCGAGAFTFRLAEVAPVLAADADTGAIASLKAGVATAPGLSPIVAEARDLYRRPVLAQELKAVDLVLFDPPRAGAIEQTEQIASSRAAKVVAVSCNPTTFARDARRLVDAGFRLDRVLPVDQFLWSSHMELAAAFSR